MLRTVVNISFFVFIILGMTSCGGPKEIATSNKKSSTAKGEVNNSEYNAFFEAEKARIKGDRSKARKLYKDFVRAHKTNAAAYYNLAKLEYQAFQFTPAEEHIRAAVKLSPKNKYYLELYADVLSVNKKKQKAAEIYETLSALSPNDDSYGYKKYKIYRELKDYDNALKALESMEDSWGISEDVVMQKVNILLKQKKEDEAVKEIQKLIDDEPREPSHKERLADLYDKLGRKDEAKQIYEQLVMDAPNDAKVLMRSSSYYLRIKDTAGFQRVIKSIVANPKIDRDIRMSMVMPLIELKNDSAYLSNEILPLINNLRKGGKEKEDKESARLYADILYNAKKYPEAAKAYREYLKIDKSKFAVWFNLMLSYSNLDELDNLIKVADESFDYFPNNAFTHYFKGTALYQKKDYKESISSLQNAIDLEPERELKAQIFSMLGDAHNSLKEYKKADENFENSLKIKEEATTLNNYAYYLSLRNERLNDALKMSKRSLELRPKTPTFLDTYGWILYKQGKYEKAKEYIEKAIEGEGDPDVLEHLGDIYFKLNDVAKANEYWQRAQKIGGGSELLEKKIRDGQLYE